MGPLGSRKHSWRSFVKRLRRLFVEDDPRQDVSQALRARVLGHPIHLYLRWDTRALPAPTLALALEAGALALGGVTAWLGGELVDRMGVGVDEGAHVNAPSSLTHETA